MRLAPLIAIVAFHGLVLAGDPPPPNLEEPVDYVAWMNQEYGKGISENAAERYQQAIDALQEDDGARDISKRPAESWSESDRSALRTWVSQNERALGEFDAASRIKKCYFPYAASSDLLILAEIKYLRPLSLLIRLATTRARLRLADGDVSGAQSDVLAALRAARHCREQPNLIAYLVGQKAGKTVYDIVADYPVRAPGDVDYESLLRELSKVDRSPPSLRHALLGERLVILDFVQHRCQDTDGDGKLDSFQHPDGTRSSFEQPTQLDALAKSIERYMRINRKIQRSKLADTGKLEREAADALDATDVVRVLAPKLGNLHKSGRLHNAKRNAARIILRLHAWRSANGGWPATLEEAMQDESRSLRRDPFANADMVYRLEKGEPLLYSVGANGDDDGGKRVEDDRSAEKGDLVFWPRT